MLAYGLARRREVRLGGWWHLAGAVLLAAIVAAWLVPACRMGGEAYSSDLLGQPWKRVVKSPSHQKPWYYYLALSPGSFFPWFLVFALALVWSARSAWRQDGFRLGLELPWFVVIFVFFSAVSGKRERYLLPVVPAAGLLCARYVWAVARGEAACSRGHKWLWRATFVLLAASGAALAAAPLAAQPLARALRLDAQRLVVVSEALASEHGAMAGGGGGGGLVVGRGRGRARARARVRRPGALAGRRPRRQARAQPLQVRSLLRSRGEAVPG